MRYRANPKWPRDSGSLSEPVWSRTWMDEPEFTRQHFGAYAWAITDKQCSGGPSWMVTFFRSQSRRTRIETVENATLPNGTPVDEVLAYIHTWLLMHVAQYKGEMDCEKD